MPWTNRELLTAFPNLIKKGQHSAKLYFFIDGLDEFEGDDATRVEIITLLKEISDSSRVKMISTLDSFYLEQAAQLFQVALHTDQAATLLTDSFLHEENPDYAIKLKVEPLKTAEVCNRFISMERL
ncbi:hypothetical protein ABVK25_005032 [Lepraria finkii]|uniref:NACHT domain-containing protein n=1 Tax=Lepraria finkii TaxID=1340010 RepID=A0ABR4BFN2_9LECA